MNEGAHRWPAGLTPGLARLRASKHGERIRQATIADQESALADASAAIAADNAAAMTAALGASRNSLIPGEPRVEQRDLIDEAMKPVKPAAALSEGATQLLNALFKVAGDGQWIDQRAIPHGFSNGKSVAAFLGGLYKRGLVDLRGDGGNRFSARMTAAGAALMAEMRGHVYMPAISVPCAAP